MELQGYAIIKSSAKTVSNAPTESFIGYPVRVLEFASDGAVLVTNSEASGLAMFDASDIHSQFKCNEFADYLIPSDCNSMLDKMNYMLSIQAIPENKLGRRDMHMIRKLIVIQSLSKGKFDDSLYFQISRKETSQ